MPTSISTRTLTGLIATPNGIPLSALEVKVFRVALPDHIEVAQCLTKPDGRYVLDVGGYTENTNAQLLLIRVFEQGSTEELARSSRFELNGENVSIDIEVDLDHYRGLSEYAWVTHCVTQVMIETEMDQAVTWNMDADHMAFIAQKTGLDVSKIDHLFEAREIITQLIDAEARHWNEVRTTFFTDRRARMQEAVYGMLRQGLPGASDIFRGVGKERLVAALRQAIRANIIREDTPLDSVIYFTIGDEKFTTDAIADEFIRLGVVASINSPEYRNMETLMGCLLQLTGINSELQLQLFEAWEASGYDRNFSWRQLKKPDGSVMELPVDLIIRLQNQARIIHLLQDDLPLYKELVRRYDLSDVRQIAWMNNAQWAIVIAAAYPTLTQQQCMIRAGEIMQIIEAVMPTAVLIPLLEHSSRVNCTLAVQFLRNNSGFEFLYTNVNTWLDERPESMDGIADKKKLREELNRLQRVFHLPPPLFRTERIVTLLELALDSGEAIRRIGQTAFKEYFSWAIRSDDDAEFIFRKAVKQSDLARFLLARYSNLFNNISTRVIGSGSLSEELPEMQSFFGPTDYWKLDQEESVLSPAAYLMDLLKFLDEIEIDGANETALIALLRSRPDIGQLLLNKENTFTELAYVDTVNEILENEVVRLGSVLEEPAGDMFELSGRLTDGDFGIPVPNARIEFFEKDEYSPDDYLGQSVTDRFGNYRFSFDSGYFKDQDETKPTVYYRVVNNLGVSDRTDLDPVVLQKRATVIDIVLKVNTQVSTLFQIYGRLEEKEHGEGWDPGLRVKYFLASEKNFLVAEGNSNLRGTYNLSFPKNGVLPFSKNGKVNLRWEIFYRNMFSLGTGAIMIDLNGPNRQENLIYELSKEEYRIGGYVHASSGYTGAIRGVQIRAYEKDKMFDDLLGIAEADENGHFDLFFTTSDFKETATDVIRQVLVCAFWDGMKVGETIINWTNRNGRPQTVAWCSVPLTDDARNAGTPMTTITRAPDDYYFYETLRHMTGAGPILNDYTVSLTCFFAIQVNSKDQTRSSSTKHFRVDNGAAHFQFIFRKGEVDALRATALQQPGVTAANLLGPYFSYGIINHHPVLSERESMGFRLIEEYAIYKNARPGLNGSTLLVYNPWAYKGTLRDEFTNGGLADYVVELWDKDKKHDDLLAKTFTNRDGNFYFQSVSHWNDSWNERAPDIYFKVYKDGALFDVIKGPGRNNPVKNAAVNYGYKAVTFTNYNPTVIGLRNYVLTGKACFPFTTIPFRWCPVALTLEWKENNRKRTLKIGSVFTNENGEYRFEFNNYRLALPYKLQPVIRFAVEYKGQSHEFARNVAWDLTRELQKQIHLNDPPEFPLMAKGRLTHEKTGEPLDGYRIEAWDKDADFDDFLGDATTGWDGDFIITFDTRYYREDNDDYWPNVYFRIFKGKNFLKSTIAQSVPTLERRVQHYELSANPPTEIKISGKRMSVNALAYDILSKNIFPRSLPFNFWEAKMDRYLHVVGLDRETLLQLKLEPADRKNSLSCALADLRISETERRIITGEKKEVWEFYNLPDANALKQLNDLSVLVSKSALDMKAISALLETQYVNPTAKTVQYMTDSVMLRMNAAEYGRMHILQRLVEKLNWSPAVLDKTLRALGAKKFGNDTLVSLSRIKKLLERFKIAHADLLVWFSPLDVRRYGETPSSYEQFIQKGEGIGTAIESWFALNETRTEVADPNRKFTGNGDENDKALILRLAACYGIRENELRMLVELELPDSKINLENLSQLHRVIHFTKALGIEFSAYGLVKEVIGLDPFRGKQPLTMPSLQSVEVFLEKYDAARRQGFSWSKLSGLLLCRPDTEPAITQEELKEKLRALYLALKPDSGDTLVSDQIDQLIIQAVADTMSFDAQRTAYLLSSYLRNPIDTMQPAVKLFALLMQEQSDQPSEMQHAIHYLEILERLHKTEWICSQLKLGKFELESWQYLGERENGYLLSALPVQRFSQSHASDIFDRWIKTTEHVVRHRRFSSKTFNYWSFACGISEFADRSVAPSLAETAAKKTETLQAAAVLFFFREEDIAWCVGPEFLSLVFPAGFEDMRWFDRMEQVGKVLGKIGMSPKALLALSAGTASENAMHAVMLAVKQKVAPGDWERTNKKIEDELVLMQRDALAAYVLAHNANFKTPEDLYAHFLVDTEMSVGRSTTRIQQAIASVQLLVQRIRLGLKHNVQLSSEQEKEWDWRKNYRVWEANRKIFLFPENWIEPELRATKTSFFKELEEELLQDEVTPDKVERAYFGYLQKLSEVARLEISGTFLEETEEATYLHVIGRTMDMPHRYYYRKQVNGSMWTPWEKIEIDIEGNHVLPVVYNRRLLLFWATFSEKSKKVDGSFASRADANGNYNTQTPEMYHEVRMYYSSYRDGRWQPKKASVEKLSCSVQDRDFTTFAPEDQDKFRHYWIDVMLDDNLNFIFRWKKTFVGKFKLLYTDGMLQVNSASVGNPTDVDNYSKNYQKLFFEKNTELRVMVNEPSLIKLNIAAFRLSVNMPLKLSKEEWWKRPFFFEDQVRTFLIRHNKKEDGFCFDVHYHPYVNLFMKHLNRYGIKGLLSPATSDPEQLAYQQVSTDFFSREYVSNAAAIRKTPIDTVDFDPEGAYAEYNWEVFFHIPLMMAVRLAENRQFEKAQEWFHYIFNPMETAGTSPQRFWKVKPFHDYYNNHALAETSIATLLRHIDDEKDKMTMQIESWESDPFQPHAIARLRPVAYMKYVVMKYLDNLIAWGDDLFGRATTESVNEATQVYVLAAQVLGDRPQSLERSETKVLTVDEMLGRLDGFSNTLINIEGRFPNIAAEDMIKSIPQGTDVLNSILYFDIPGNIQLLAYWDLVDDRLYKIRHSLSIEGKPQELSVYAPPLDPGSMVDGPATGNYTFSFSLSHYRFEFLLQKALDVCRDVQSLGGALLSVLEKADAEEMSLLRNKHERAMLKIQRDNKVRAIEETKINQRALDQTKIMTEARRQYYAEKGKSAAEESQIGQMQAAMWVNIGAAGVEMLAGAFAAIPDVTIGVSGAFGSPVVTTRLGGSSLSTVANMAGKALHTTSTILGHTSGITGLNVSWERRQEEWTFMKQTAEHELRKIDIDLRALEQRLAIVDHELTVHDNQQEQAEATEELLKSKFTNQQLYQWMKGRISTVYFQAFQMAQQLALQAERAYEFETGEENARIIGTNQWDSFNKGLLAGEWLMHDLRKLEMRYFEKNKREYELNRHFPLSQLDPLALAELRKTGKCSFSIPEVLFDIDYPGHYSRRIKAVTLTIPCVTGPYTQVSATLTLQSSRVRKNATLKEGVYARQQDDDRFIDYIGTTESIATSTANNDSGLFELSFRDERYLPFERAGAISDWHLELPDKFRQFDYDSISDVILHMNYTAKEGGDTLKPVVAEHIETGLNELLKFYAASGQGFQTLFSFKVHFPNQLHQLLNPAPEEDNRQTVIDITPRHFSHYLSKANLQARGMTLFIKLKEGAALSPDMLRISLGQEDKPLPVSKSVTLSNEPYPYAAFTKGLDEGLFRKWTIRVSGEGLPDFKADEVDDVLLLLDMGIVDSVE